VTADDRDLLCSIAATAMVGKAIACDNLAPLCVDAIRMIRNGTIDVFNDVMIRHSVGKRIEDTELIPGIVIDKSRVNDAMPKRVKGARIALLTSGIEYRKFGKMPGGKSKDKVKIHSADELQNLYDGEESAIRSDIDVLADIGVNVVFCAQSITESSQSYLVKRGIVGVARVKDADLEAISRATGATIISNIVDVEERDLGAAGLVEEKGAEDEELIYITDCTDPKTVSLVVHGGTEHVVEVIEGALNDALRVVADAVMDGTVVAGGGACEIELALRVRDYAATVGGKEQLAINAFAEALEEIPHALAENSGLDTTNIITALKSKHIAGAGAAFGIDIYNGEIVDMYAHGVVEPFRVKNQLLKSATDATTMILKVDDVIASERKELTPSPGQAPHDYDRF